MAKFRVFPRLIGTLFALIALISPLSAGAKAPAPVRAAVDLDGDWRFLRADATGDPSQPAFDDSGWSAVRLPHTWNATDGQDGPSTPYYRGVGWYRRHFRPAAHLENRRLYLQFDAAATVARVYVNGKPVGEHRGSFGGFCFDVTGALLPGQDNLIAVKVNNAHDRDIAPLSGDFTVYGGIYRDVRLLALDPLAITPTDDDGPGVYARPVRVDEKSADLAITVKLRNDTPTPQKATVAFAIEDADGKAITRAKADQPVPAGGAADLIEPMALRNPHLWDGVNDPYLYHLVAEVYAGKRLTDRVVQPLGIRFFHVDPNRGLILNGRRYEVHGVNRHQDRLGKGWAISAADHKQDYDLIRAMGSTGIRLSHYQHAQVFYDLCDAGGLVVWAELPLVNSLTDSDGFRANARQQLTELIKQNYNHPSILFWSLFNELHFKSGSKNPAEWDQVVELNALAHRLDPTRLTTAASSLGTDHPVNFITDVIALNRYYGWYGGTPGEWALELDAMHQKYPTRCIAISEYGAGASINQHEALPPRQPKPGGPWHPEEWQSALHQAAWGAMRERPWLWGTFLWCMYDFGSDGRKEGDAPGRNDKGMVTMDRAVEKDAYFFYQANWTAPELSPMVHIASRRFNPRPAGAVIVEVYSNCPTVSLSMNGKDLGSGTAINHVFRWTDVTLKIGDNRVSAVATTSAGKRIADACVWTGTESPPVPAGIAPAPAVVK